MFWYLYLGTFGEEGAVERDACGWLDRGTRSREERDGGTGERKEGSKGDKQAMRCTPRERGWNCLGIHLMKLDEHECKEAGQYEEDESRDSLA